MSDKKEQAKPKAPAELFEVRDLVANDPDFPKNVLPSRKRSRKADRRRPAEKPTRDADSGKSSVYLWAFLGILGFLIVIPSFIFILIRYVLPPFR